MYKVDGCGVRSLQIWYSGTCGLYEGYMLIGQSARKQTSRANKLSGLLSRNTSKPTTELP